MQVVTMDWLRGLWERATRRENAVWWGVGTAAVITGGAALYYVTANREQTIAAEQREMQMQLEGPEGRRGAEEAVIARAPVRVAAIEGSLAASLPSWIWDLEVLRLLHAPLFHMNPCALCPGESGSASAS